MSFTITVILFSTRQSYTLLAEQVTGPIGYKRYKVSGKTKAVIIQKKDDLNNSPWELVEGNWSKISSADFYDLIRQMGAGIERGY